MLIYIRLTQNPLVRRSFSVGGIPQTQYPKPNTPIPYTPDQIPYTLFFYEK